MITQEEIRLKCLEIASRNHKTPVYPSTLIADARELESYVSENTQERALLMLTKLLSNGPYNFGFDTNDIDGSVSLDPFVSEWVVAYQSGSILHTTKVK